MNDNDLTPQAAILTASFSHAPATPAPTAPTTPPVAPVVEPHSKAGVSDTEAAKIAAWTREDLAAGKISQSQADKIFSELNVPAEDRVTKADTRSDEQKLIDAHFPVAKPEEFSIRYADPGQVTPRLTPELAQFDQSARTWLSQAEFPRELGNSIITTIERVAQTTKHMDANQLEQYGVDEFAKLERVYGKELDAKLQAAGRMVEDLENSNLVSRTS
jgi:hypothetical protein